MPRCFRWRTRSWMSPTAIGSMPAKGSSSRMKEGRAASARAISQRRRSPPDSAIDGDLRSRAMSNSSRSCSSRCSRLRAVALVDFEHGADVVLDVEAAEDRGLLRQIADAEPRALVHRQRRHVMAVERDDALVGLHQAGDHVEHRGLAGAVGAEQADRLALAHRPATHPAPRRARRSACRDYRPPACRAPTAPPPAPARRNRGVGRGRSSAARLRAHKAGPRNDAGFARHGDYFFLCPPAGSALPGRNRPCTREAPPCTAAWPVARS